MVCYQPFSEFAQFSLEIRFPELLKASPHYEPDPSKADFHYVHVYMYHAASRSHFGSGDYGLARAEAIVGELRQLGPWWDASNHTHIWPLPTDMGICRVPVSRCPCMGEGTQQFARGIRSH